MAHFNSYPILIKIIHFQLTLRQKLWWFNPSIVFYAVCYEFAVHSNSDQIMFLLYFVYSFLVGCFFCVWLVSSSNKTCFIRRTKSMQKKSDVLSSTFRIDYTHSLSLAGLNAFDGSLNEHDSVYSTALLILVFGLWKREKEKENALW